jgi:ABC-type amino acid transport substrate-binding protein
LTVVQSGITQEDLGVAVRRDDLALAERVDRALDDLRADGTLARLGRDWLGTDADGSTTSVVT